jgi:hypothetical protein
MNESDMRSMGRAGQKSGQFVYFFMKPAARFCCRYCSLQNQMGGSYSRLTFIVMIVTMIMIMTVAMAVNMLVFIVMVMFVMAMVMFVLLTVGIVIPVFGDEINLTVAGIVLVAVLLPVFVMFFRNAQIHRRINDFRWRCLNDNWLGINHRRWCDVANLDLSEKIGVSDVDRDAHLGVCQNRCRNQG